MTNCLVNSRDNYGFVTFKYKMDAYEAIQHGNDDPSFPKADICFGGRRTFCKEKYSDLGKLQDSDQSKTPIGELHCLSVACEVA